MKKIKPTLEQFKILKAIKNTSDNLLIEAYAGCGKTTVIVDAVKLIERSKKVLFLAFNRHIKEELEEKLPSNAKCYTSHGLGLGALKRKYPNIQFDEFKVDKIINNLSNKWDLKSRFKLNEEITDYLADLKKLVNISRLTLSLTPKAISYQANMHEIKINKETDMKRVLKILDKVSSDVNNYDYTDMIYLPSIDKSIWFFPQDIIFVDENQDLNRCQIRIIEKSLKKDRKTKKVLGRLISVGDKYQSIYGFMGANSNSFSWFEKYPNTIKLPLSHSFRCAKSIIKEANELVPNIKALDNAPDGIVRNGNVIEEAESGDFVLCRKVLPLVKLFFEFLNKNKKAVIKGSDIGINLIEYIKEFQNINTLITFYERKLNNLKLTLQKEGINPNEHSGFVTLEDKVNVITFFAKQSKTIQELIEIIKLVFSEKIEGIVLSTIHKSKGLEANRVFIIRPDLLPLPTSQSWQHQQEKNIEYVAITRAKNELIYDVEWND